MTTFRFIPLLPFCSTIATTSLLLGLSWACLASAPAAAQQIDAQAACTPDVQRLCSEFIPDRARITACLEQKRRSLSPACRTFFAGPEKKVAKRKTVKKKKKWRRRRY